MSPSSVAILTDPQPRDHIVYPYTNEAHAVEAVSLFAAAGLRKGEAVLLVMTDSHADRVRDRLEDGRFDLDTLEASGQFTCVDARALLSTFLRDGVLDELAFNTNVGNTIETLKARAGNRPLRIFGEMVNLIWKTDLPSTVRLEELWNEAIQAHSVSLLCAYSLAGTVPSEFPEALLKSHSEAVV